MLHILMYMSCTCSLDGFCIAPDTIAYAKLSGADSIAWRTQLHLTPIHGHKLEAEPRRGLNCRFVLNLLRYFDDFYVKVFMPEAFVKHMKTNRFEQQGYFSFIILLQLQIFTDFLFDALLISRTTTILPFLKALATPFVIAKDQYFHLI